MTCKALVDRLEAYLTGEIPHPERERFEEHLSRCANCRRYVDSYRSTIRWIEAVAADREDAPSAEVSEDLVRAVLARRTRGP